MHADAEERSSRQQGYLSVEKLHSPIARGVRVQFREKVHRAAPVGVGPRALSDR